MHKSKKPPPGVSPMAASRKTLDSSLKPTTLIYLYWHDNDTVNEISTKEMSSDPYFITKKEEDSPKGGKKISIKIFLYF